MRIWVSDPHAPNISDAVGRPCDLPRPLQDEFVAIWVIDCETTSNVDETNAADSKRRQPVGLNTQLQKTPYEQPGNLKLAIQVLQLNVPLDFRYSLVYQKVQSSTGSTVIAL